MLLDMRRDHPSVATGPILARLVALYENRGIKVATGLNSHHFGDFPLAPFTWFIRGRESLTNGLGIGLQEIYFLECLFARFRPERLFVIGNSFGWSTLALALMNRDARVVAIDAGLDRNSLEGIEFTNRVAEEEGLKALAVKGRSPGDVATILRDHAMSPLHFVLVDGYHSVEQVQLDFEAARPAASPDCIYLFHDVETFQLQEGLERIAAKTGFVWELLPATPSGMALVYDPGHCPVALEDIAPFRPDPVAVEIVRDAAWGHRHRHLARWHRSLRKRLGGSRR